MAKLQADGLAVLGVFLKVLFSLVVLPSKVSKLKGGCVTDFEHPVSKSQNIYLSRGKPKK